MQENGSSLAVPKHRQAISVGATTQTHWVTAPPTSSRLMGSVREHVRILKTGVHCYSHTLLVTAIPL